MLMIVIIIMVGAVASLRATLTIIGGTRIKRVIMLGRGEGGGGTEISPNLFSDSARAIVIKRHTDRLSGLPIRTRRQTMQH